ncbi:BTB/POZ and MATH domain-containing protein 1-like isoform X1 [Hordeum vulgare subsp. vulgare]|uniref:BTB domain-containing protein n=2 Tax=Hordeum vulgare subsp. vulgare TaxID=112509 RepID=A0A287XZN1_HORVV|nr:BTB/POZ and MATH domain-containing protein 1-like isoform X1 [Hordeum vulgare subsp. vulgare]
MSFAGVSVIANGNLLKSSTSPATAGASGYHLLVVEGHSQTSNMPQGKVLVSRYFTVGGHRWLIFYYPNGKDNLHNTGFISLGLSLHTEEEPAAAEPVKALADFTFVDDTDKQMPECMHGDKIFEFTGNTVRRQDMEISKHLKDDSFTIRCDVMVLSQTCNTSAFIIVPPCDMQRNFTDLLLSGNGSDVAFQVGGETFAAHRCILAARSAVFRAALFGTMYEGTSKVVQVDDMDAAVFKAMLGFIYGGSLPTPGTYENEGVLLQHLLIAADRYDLPRLRAMCEKKLCEHLDMSTATTILMLAEQHGCNGLKKACCEFLQYPDNLRAVVATDGFDHLCRSCPSLMKDMILGVLPAKRKRE